MNIKKMFSRFNKNKLLTPEAYKEMIEEKREVILLDVRTQSEFDASHIPNAVLFPVSKIKDYFHKTYPDKNLIYIIYCRSGIRSHIALNIMKQLGYSEVFDMGGIIDWPYEIISN